MRRLLSLQRRNQQLAPPLQHRAVAEKSPPLDCRTPSTLCVAVKSRARDGCPGQVYSRAGEEETRGEEESRPPAPPRVVVSPAAD